MSIIPIDLCVKTLTEMIMFDLFDRRKDKGKLCLNLTSKIKPNFLFFSFKHTKQFLLACSSTAPSINLDYGPLYRGCNHDAADPLMLEQMSTKMAERSYEDLFPYFSTQNTRSPLSQ